jgi:SAM-dependent methyltransferase
MGDDRPDDVAAGYDRLARRADGDLDAAVSPWGDSHFQRHYAWPATRAALPPVDGRAVLLAGCGCGDHVDWFLASGATVTGVDVSRAAIERARARASEGVADGIETGTGGGAGRGPARADTDADGDADRASFLQADLAGPLPVAADSVEVVVCHLVASHLDRWRPTFEEFRRVLTPDGRLVVTTIHPAYFRHEHGVADAYERRRLAVDWDGVTVPTFYRPTSVGIRAFLEAGFRLGDVSEPRPRETLATHAPDRYRQALRRPELLVVRAMPA